MLKKECKMGGGGWGQWDVLTTTAPYGELRTCLVPYKQTTNETIKPLTNF